MANRYYLHISSNENRDSILENGLIPKSIMDSNQFDYEHRKDLHNDIGGPKIFATPFGNSIDAYSIMNITSRVFPLPMISNAFTEEEYEILADETKEKSGFNNMAKKAKEDYEAMKARGSKYAEMSYYEEMEEIERKFNSYFNRVCLEAARNFDIWLIDNEIARCEWEEDPNGYDDTVGETAYMTSEPISTDAIELLVPNNTPMRGEIPNENLNYLISFERFKFCS